MYHEDFKEGRLSQTVTGTLHQEICDKESMSEPLPCLKKDSLLSGYHLYKTLKVSVVL